MLAKRIIPCLDVSQGQVVKGVQFKNHQVVGDILPLALRYSNEGADELVFYDITASTEQDVVSKDWVSTVALLINIPFTVAGGIKSLKDAQAILNAGADKISINSPALNQPKLINELNQALGAQCVVIGIDSKWVDDDYYVFQYTGKESTSCNSGRKTREWLLEVQDRGAGEIVLNCMHSDGLRQGFDCEQLQQMAALCHIPLVASGGAGKSQDFIDVFLQTNASGALAASIFHKNLVQINEIKTLMAENNLEVRL